MTQTQTLWENLTRTLSPLLDAHGVSAAVATEFAKVTNLTMVVAVYNQYKRLYDVWVAIPDGGLKQTRWEQVEDAMVEVGKANKTIYLDKYKRPASEQIRSELWHLAHDGVLVTPLPLPTNDFTPRGALIFIDPPLENPFIPEEIDVLAMHVSTYLDRAYLRQKSVQQEIEFAIVSDISYALTATLDLGHIYNQLSDPVRRTLNVESISIGLYDTLSEEIVFVNKLMGPLFDGLPPVRLKKGQGIAGYVAQHAEPLIVNRAYDDRRFFSRIDHVSGFETHSILCVPLLLENRVIGVLEAVNKRSGQFTRQDLRLLNAISGPLAAAVENTNLHMEVVSEKRRIETMFNSMSEGMMTINRAGLITSANDALRVMLQIEEEMIGKEAEKIVYSAKGEFTDFMNSVFKEPESYPQLTCALQPHTGEPPVPVLVSGTAIEDEGGRIGEAIYVFSDLRQMRELERMRDDFFHNIIHELRTPLATILMYGRLIQDGKTDGDIEKRDRFLGVIVRESDRLQRMVRQMLQVVKLEAKEIQRSSELVDMNVLFNEILPPLADSASEKGLIFMQKVPANLPHILGNEETLYIIFKNLVENAVKFTLAGAVRVTVVTDGRMITVRVQDEGIGIPKQAMPNLFKRFYRSATAVERGIAGTGLGLYMVKEGVEKHGGTIEVESVAGEGTTFTVKMPGVPA